MHVSRYDTMVHWAEPTPRSGRGATGGLGARAEPAPAAAHGGGTDAVTISRRTLLAGAAGSAGLAGPTLAENAEEGRRWWALGAMPGCADPDPPVIVIGHATRFLPGFDPFADWGARIEYRVWAPTGHLHAMRQSMLREADRQRLDHERRLLDGEPLPDEAMDDGRRLPPMEIE